MSAPPDTDAAGATPPESEPTDIRAPIDVRSVSLTLIAFLAVIVILRYAEAMIIPIVLGVLIKYALDPVVSGLVRMHIPRALASAIVLLTLVAASGTLVYQLRFEAEALARQLPGAARQLRQALERDGRGEDSAFEKVQQAATELEKANGAGGSAAPPGVTRVQVEERPIDIGDYVAWGSLGIAAAIAQGVLVLFLAYFLLASGDLYRRKLVKVVGPSLTEKKVTVQILDEIDQQIAWFLMVQVLTSTLVGVASWLVFRWIGLEQAALWGLLAGVLNSIPYFGPVIVTGSVAVVAFLQFGTFTMPLVAAGMTFVITTLEGMLLTPWLNSQAAHMNAGAVFIGLIFWGWVWEVWGLLLAVPMLMVVKAICDRVEDLKPVGELLGD